MPTKYRFVTDGDFVNFYDDAQLVFVVEKASTVLSWKYDSTPGIVFQMDGYGYHTDDVGDISFDGVVVTSGADFVTKAQAMFPNLTVGESSETPGIDDVLAEGQNITANREIFASGFDLTIVTNALTISGGEIIGNDEPFKITGSGDEFQVIGHDMKIIGDNAQINLNNGVKVQGIPSFSDNAAALAGGVDVNGIYYTDVGGERILKIAHD